MKLTEIYKVTNDMLMRARQGRLVLADVPLLARCKMFFYSEWMHQVDREITVMMQDRFELAEAKLRAEFSEA